MPGLVRLDPQALFAPIERMSTVGLAVSGGPDSLALMVLAREWALDAGRPRLVVYSVDHGLRPEAADEVAMVVAEAARLGLAARALRWEGDKPETGVQAAARKARYRLLAAAMIEDGAEVLVTAHHLADQAETVLMRLAHGSGVEGLRGMDMFARVEGCRLFRPLLGVDPEVLAGIVAQAGLVPARDPGNHDRHYERVRWRQMLAGLEELGLDARRLGKFAARMADADALIDVEADKAFAALVERGEGGDAQLPHAGFAALPRIVGVRLIGHALRLVGGERKPHALASVETLHAQLAAGLPQRASTLHGCIIASDGTTISIRREGARRAVSAAHDELTADGL
jgi:tRNA(Ile)-lysidine synthase